MFKILVIYSGKKGHRMQLCPLPPNYDNFRPNSDESELFLIIIIVIVLVHRRVIPQTHVIHSDVFFQLSGHIIAHCCEYFKKCGAKLSRLRACEISSLPHSYGELILVRKIYFQMLSKPQTMQRELLLNNF